MRVLRCDRCGFTQGDPKDRAGWCGASVEIYGAGWKSEKEYDVNYCPDCTKQLEFWRLEKKARVALSVNVF